VAASRRNDAGCCGTDRPVAEQPVDDGCYRCRRERRAGERQRAEQAAVGAAEAAGQRDEAAGELAGGVGEQQAVPGDGSPGELERGGEYGGFGKLVHAAEQQHRGSSPVSGLQPRQAGRGD
jgi:hypothetical protein